LGWKKEEAFKNSDWHKLIASLKTLQNLGTLSPRDLFLLGYAHSNLDQMKDALRFMEFIQASLEDINEEALRYCTHAWILYRLGDLDQATAILEHSISEKWPAHRIQWAKDFQDSIRRSEFLNDEIFRPKLSIH
jgi:tetratricopeptide (TPR) repeat protein